MGELDPLSSTATAPVRPSVVLSSTPSTPTTPTTPTTPATPPTPTSTFLPVSTLTAPIVPPPPPSLPLPPPPQPSMPTSAAPEQGEQLEEAVPKFEPGDRLCEFKILEKIDEGGFGQVFKAIEVTNPEKGYLAVKIESNTMEGGSAIKLETLVLRTLTERKVPNYPTFYMSRRRSSISYIVMDLLGPNLKALRLKSPNPDKWTPSTWARVSIQCLYNIKLLHDNGFVHRDIKPSNFALGNRTTNDVMSQRILYTFDFGLARQFIFNTTDRGKYFRKPRRTAEFRGTQRYSSPNAHLLKDLGRVDDIYSLMFMIIEMSQPLPWQCAIETSEIESMKVHMKDHELLINFPEFLPIFSDLRTCNYYSRPDYLLVYKSLRDIMRKHDVKETDPYDWELAGEDNYKKWRSERERRNHKYIWEDAYDFFKDDPYKELPVPAVSPSIEFGRPKKSEGANKCSSEFTSESTPGRPNPKKLTTPTSAGSKAKAASTRKKDTQKAKKMASTREKPRSSLPPSLRAAGTATPKPKADDVPSKNK